MPVKFITKGGSYPAQSAPDSRAHAGTPQQMLAGRPSECHHRRRLTAIWGMSVKGGGSRIHAAPVEAPVGGLLISPSG